MHAVKPYIKLTKRKILISRGKEYTGKIKQHLKLINNKDKIYLSKNELNKDLRKEISKKDRLYNIFYYAIIDFCIITTTATLFIHNFLYFLNNEAWLNAHSDIIIPTIFIVSLVGTILSGYIVNRKYQKLLWAGAIVGFMVPILLSYLLMQFILPVFLGNIMMSASIATGSYFLIRYIYNFKDKTQTQKKQFNPKTIILLLLGLPTVLFLAINYLVLNKFYPTYAITSNLLFSSQSATQSESTTRFLVQPITASNLSGKWNTRVGESAGVIYLNQKGNTIYGNIYYQGVNERLRGEIHGNNHVVLRGISFKRLRGRERFKLDTFNGNVTRDLKSIRGNYIDAAGHNGYWFAAKVSKEYKSVAKAVSMINISGEWKGDYTQRNVWGEETKSDFQIELVQNNERLTGTITEKANGNTLTANIVGTVKGRIIKFVKQYNNAYYPPITYKGAIGKGGFISGTWQNNNSSGKWVIMKQ